MIRLACPDDLDRTYLGIDEAIETAQDLQFDRPVRGRREAEDGAGELARSQTKKSLDGVSVQQATFVIQHHHSIGIYGKNSPETINYRPRCIPRLQVFYRIYYYRTPVPGIGASYGFIYISAFYLPPILPILTHNCQLNVI